MAGPAGQVTHLVGDHRKPSPGLTGPRRLDGCIQCQQVGLLGNSLDFAQHAENLPHLGGDAIGHFDQFHRQLRVLDHAIDKAAQGFRGLSGKLLEIGDAVSAAVLADDLKA